MIVSQYGNHRLLRLAQIVVASLWLFLGQTEAQSIVYHWRPGDAHNYRLTIESEFEETTIRVNGKIGLRVKGPVANSSDVDGQRLPARENGVGLLVGPKHLVTSLNLIDQSDRIEIKFSGKSNSAKTIATDAFSNLGLLELSEECEFSEPSIALESSLAPQSQVEVLDFSSQEPRILLGRVTGYRSHNDRRNFFITVDDNVAILGIPVVDREGNIIGMISSERNDLQNSWIATPAEEIYKLASSVAIETSKSEPQDLTADQALVKYFQTKLTAVTAVRVHSGNSLSGIEFEASYKTSLTRRNKLLFPEFPERESDSGNLLVSQSGQVIRFEGADHLPFLLGPLGSFPIEFLGNKEQEAWKIESPSSVETVERAGPFGIYGMAPFYQNRNEKIIATTAAVEKADYRISEVEPPLLKINKEYKLQTLDHDERPTFRFVGTGTILFDTKLGIVVSNEFKGTIERNSKSTTLRLPIKISLERISQEQVKAELEIAAKRAEALRLKRETPLTKTEMSKIMDDLKSGEMSRQMNAMSRLSKKSPKEGDQELALFLIGQVNDKQLTRSHYRQVLENWATPDMGPKLLELIPTTEDSFLRSTMIRLVTKFKTSGTVEVIAPFLAFQRDRWQIEQALKNFGSAAEEPTLKHLANSDRWVRHSAIAVLAVVGTEQSVAPLQEIADNDTDRSLQHSAKQAIQAIRSRSK